MEFILFKKSFAIVLVLVIMSLIAGSPGGPLVTSLSAVAQSTREPLPTNSTQAAPPSNEELNIMMAQISASNNQKILLRLLTYGDFHLLRWKDNLIM